MRLEPGETLGSPREASPDSSHQESWKRLMRAIEECHPYREPLFDTKMPRFPGDLLARTQQPGGSPRHRSLARAFRSVLVRINAAREIENAFDRSVDESDQMNH